MTIEPWHIVGLVVTLLVPVSAGCLYYAVKRDAAARGANGGPWGLAVLLLPPVAGPVYAAYRRRLPARTESPGRTERRLGAVGIGGVTAFVVASAVTPPDPYTLISVALPLYGVFVPLAAVLCYDWNPRAVWFGTS